MSQQIPADHSMAMFDMTSSATSFARLLQGGLEAVRGVSSGGDRPHGALQGRLQGARHHAVKQNSRRTTVCRDAAQQQACMTPLTL
jgi:hypothetical protein